MQMYKQYSSPGEVDDTSVPIKGAPHHPALVKTDAIIFRKVLKSCAFS